MSLDPPKLFVSYSHDSQSHKDWVLSLSTRLMANGVDVVLDQWDLALGADLPRFMEQGLSAAKRILVICTKAYVVKANAAKGGVGYEKMIITAQLMRDVSSDRIIPVVREGTAAPLVPIFLSSRMYVDFRKETSFELKYAELVRDIHGQRVKPRPPVGPSPFATEVQTSTPRILVGPERYVAPALFGSVTFDYSNNNGRFIFGAGDMAFETKWSGGGSTMVYAYDDPQSIRTVALATNVYEIADVIDASAFDTSSRVRSPYVGQVVIWQNTAGYYLATKVTAVSLRGPTGGEDILSLTYKIATNKSNSFVP